MKIGFSWLHRLRSSWGAAQRSRFLRQQFQNAQELIECMTTGAPCDQAICRDGLVIHHPQGRSGFVRMLLEVWYEQIYTFGFYQPQPKDVIIDAGANIGLFSLWLARNHPQARVLAFEPFPENFLLLQSNIQAANASTTVETFPFALAGQSGSAAMIDGGGRSQDHRLQPGAITPNDGIGVQTIPLTEIIQMASGQVALFKCDIEGSEQDVFRTADEQTLRRLHRLAVEYHDNLRPGTLQLLKERLSSTHELSIHPAPGGYGMLYGLLRN